MVILGLLKIFVSLILGKSLEEILKKFPLSILGILLVSGGMELAIHGLSVIKENGYTIVNVPEQESSNLVVFTISTGITFQLNTFYGYIYGMLLYYYYYYYPLLIGGMIANSSDENISIE